MRRDRDGARDDLTVVAAARRRLAVAPTTRAGRWAVGLALAFPVLMVAWSILPGGAMLAFASGLAVFAAVLPLVLVVAFVLAELLVGHD